MCSFAYLLVLLPGAQPRTGLSSENGSIPLIADLLGFGGAGTHDESAALYLKQSIRAELANRLSPTAKVVFDGDEGFEHSNGRYTNYKRPTYIAGVQISTEQDVIETVRSHFTLQ